MILGSHNSWTFLPAKKWWMKLIAFTAKCQNINISKQYAIGVRCFDLRVRFEEDKLIVAHGIIEYDISKNELFCYLNWLNLQKDQVYIRILHEVRNKGQYTNENIKKFVDFIIELQCKFTNLKFWCGRNLFNWKEDYEFPFKPSCEEKYASVCSPKIIDDWCPILFAKRNNKSILEKGTDKDILLIDFVNYGY